MRDKVPYDYRYTLLIRYLWSTFFFHLFYTIYNNNRDRLIIAIRN